MDSFTEIHALQIARVLGDPTRFLIYKQVTEEGETRCGEIGADTAVRASTVSHHLKVLSDAGLVDSRRDGQAVYYRCIVPRLAAYVHYLQDLQEKGQRSCSIHRTDAMSGGQQH